MNEETRNLLRRTLEMRDRPAMDHLLFHMAMMQVATSDEIERVLLQELATADHETREYWFGDCDCQEAGHDHSRN